MSSDGGSSDTPARASRRVSLSTVARRSIGWDDCGILGGSGAVDIVFRLGSNLGVDSDGDGGGSSRSVSNGIRRYMYIVLSS
jgi:hypothetical protein